MRSKEFLSKHGIDFIAVDVNNDPRARDLLIEHGVRQIPALSKGGKYVVAKNLDLVAQFIGLKGSGHVPLPPHELFAKWIIVLRAAQRYVRQIPDGLMNQKATESRNRDLALLSHHIFSIGDALLECVLNGARDLDALTSKSLGEGMATTGAAIARRGDDVIERLQRWWNLLQDKSCSQKMDIVNYGVISLHRMLDRCTWHAAHHTRQIATVLEEQGIAPDGRLTAEDFAGLTMPERVWE